MFKPLTLHFNIDSWRVSGVDYPCAGVSLVRHATGAFWVVKLGVYKVLAHIHEPWMYGCIIKVRK